MIQNGPDESWKTTVLYFLHEVYDIVRLCTLRFQINIRVQINVRAGKFEINNKHTGPNKDTGWKIYQ